jgi:glycosyltransferase involved in cell wall biosynthesis
MVRSYRAQKQRLGRLEGYARVITGSAHMQEEYRRHLSHPERVEVLPMPAVPDDATASAGSARDIAGAPELELLFVGRMDRHKGGRVLAKALPLAARQLGRPIHLRAVGDGPDRAGFEATTRDMATAQVRTSFVGWLPPVQVREEMARAHLLVVPSLWPEPFGLVGPEAGSHGLPAAAFAVGGIGEWLADGVNGHLAPGRRPTPEGLASAIHACLHAPDHYRSLSAGAVTRAHSFTVSRHVDALVAVLRDVAHGPAVAGSGAR